MIILILGYSRIARKRVIPALAQIDNVKQVEVASVSSANRVVLPEKIAGAVYNDYDAALSASKANVVYVSTFNGDHSRLIEKALKRGFHVIVDKPAMTDYRDAKMLAILAREKRLCLAEATAYAFHPQIIQAKNIFLDADRQPKRLTVIFTFPPIDANDFRYDKDLGGGALLDLGPYAVSIGRVFFEVKPDEVFCRLLSFGGKNNVETAFSLLATYPGGRAMVGHFGFDAEYRNYVNILSEGVSLEFERVFTIPHDQENILKIKQANQPKEVKATAGDCFALYLDNVLAGIRSGDYQYHIDNLLSDAYVLQQLRLAANGAA
ncbi:Gfo/Idh/MocA family oxidoreductase [Candidatus Saganbacteria bacterium]|nr:Gfo/Idh/MocA family oxidoreductase [Candidatus Saganbacteria bacterium]